MTKLKGADWRVLRLRSVETPELSSFARLGRWGHLPLRGHCLTPEFHPFRWAAGPWILRTGSRRRAPSKHNAIVAVQLGFNADVADATDEVVGDGLVGIHTHDLDGVGVVVGTQDEMIVGEFHVLDSAGVLLADSVHVEIAFTIRLERVVVAVEENNGAGEEAGIHAHAAAAIHANDNKTFPGFAITLGFGTETAEEGAMELEELLDTHAHDEGLGGGDTAVDNADILKLILAGRRDAGAFVDFIGIEQVEDGQFLDLEDFVHAFQAQATLAVEEIGNVGLAEAGFLGEAESGEFTVGDALPKALAEIVLQSLEFHASEV